MEQDTAAKSRNSSNNHKENDVLEIDKKRLFIGALLFVAIAGAGFFWVKNSLPHFLAAQQKAVQENGQVAGQADINLEQFREQIDTIKRDVTQLKPEDIKEQEPVQKILEDLEGLKAKASESAKIFDVKENLCEEVKKRFCDN